MYYRLFISMAFCLLVSCQASQQAVSSQNSPDSPAQTSGAQNGELTTLKGVFRSSRAVKDPLSCFCFDGGYLTTSTGESFAICFDNLRSSPDCESIELSGNFSIITNEPEPGSACAKGEMKIFRVTTFRCE